MIAILISQVSQDSPRLLKLPNCQKNDSLALMLHFLHNPNIKYLAQDLRSQNDPFSCPKSAIHSQKPGNEEIRLTSLSDMQISGQS